MKKLSIIATVAIIAMASASCSHSPKASLHNDIDTLSYAIGLANGGQVKQYMIQQGVDTAYMAEFVTAPVRLLTTPVCVWVQI